MYDVSDVHVCFIMHTHKWGEEIQINKKLHQTVQPPSLQLIVEILLVKVEYS